MPNRRVDRHQTRGSSRADDPTSVTTKISRWGISRQVTRAFRGSWNCTKVLAQTRQSTGRELTIAGWPVEHYTVGRSDKTDTCGSRCMRSAETCTCGSRCMRSIKTYLEHIHEAVCTGAEGYPHLYGVIDCPDPDHPGESICHVYLEPVGSPFSTLSVQRPRDWYEIIYQITVGAEYDREIIGFTAAEPLEGLSWAPLESTRRLEYTLDKNTDTLVVHHNYQVLRWTDSPVPTPDDWLQRVSRALIDHLSAQTIPPTPMALEYLAALADGMPLTEALARWYLKKKADPQGTPAYPSEHRGPSRI